MSLEDAYVPIPNFNSCKHLTTEWKILWTTYHLSIAFGKPAVMKGLYRCLNLLWLHGYKNYVGPESVSKHLSPPTSSYIVSLPFFEMFSESYSGWNKCISNLHSVLPYIYIYFFSILWKAQILHFTQFSRNWDSLDNDRKVSIYSHK